MIINSNVRTLGQLGTILDYSENIIEMLDESALIELFSGSSDDVDSIFDTIINEVDYVLHGSDQNKKRITNASFGYLDKLSTNIEETLCCLNLGYFIDSKMPDFEINWHHLEWSQLVGSYKYLCVIAARDHSKSFFFSNAYPIWKLYRYQKSSKLIKVPKEFRLSEKGILVTNEYSLAKEHLETIKDTIESVPELSEKLKPASNRGQWGKEEIKTKTGAKLMVKSFGSKMRGYHPGWFIVDDFLNDSNLYSQDQRQKYINHFHSVIMNAIVPDGQVCVVGTPFSDLDLYSDLKKKKGWKVFEYPAIFPNGDLLWENRYNIDKLLEKLDTQGSIIFSREILVKPVTSESTIFPYSLIKGSFIGMDKYSLVRSAGNHPIKFKRIGVGVDIARSGNVGADYFVIIVLGVDDHGRYWLLQMIRDKGLRYGQQLAHLQRINRDFRPETIGIEDNQMQAFLVDGAEDAGLPVVGLRTHTNKYDLKTGLPGMVVLFEQQKIKFPRGDEKSIAATDIIASELSSIAWTEKNKLESVGAHDDTGMALWKAIKACNYVSNSFNASWL